MKMPAELPDRQRLADHELNSVHFECVLLIKDQRELLPALPALGRFIAERSADIIQQAKSYLDNSNIGGNPLELKRFLAVIEYLDGMRKSRVE